MMTKIVAPVKCVQYTPYQIQTRSVARGALSAAEKVYIITALGLGPEHWYSCPNEHLYCVGECGGPVMVSKCPECGADIGGTGMLLPDNKKDVKMAKFYRKPRKLKIFAVGSLNTN